MNTMTIDRGFDFHAIPPTDGAQDKRTTVRCSGCQQMRECYRGPLLKEIVNALGTWQQWTWLCEGCMAAIVGEALRESE